jgi:hypothetical protein
VAEASCHRAHIDSRSNELRRREVSQVVQSNPLKSKPASDPDEKARNGVRPKWHRPIWLRREDERCRLDRELDDGCEVVQLGSMLPKDSHTDVIERDVALSIGLR